MSCMPVADCNDVNKRHGVSPILNMDIQQWRERFRHLPFWARTQFVYTQRLVSVIDTTQTLTYISEAINIEVLCARFFHSYCWIAGLCLYTASQWQRMTSSQVWRHQALRHSVTREVNPFDLVTGDLVTRWHTNRDSVRSSVIVFVSLVIVNE